MHQLSKVLACVRARVLVPLEISPLPIQPPLVGRPDELEFRHGGFHPFLRIIPSRPALADDHIMPFHDILQPQFILEMDRAPPSTELTHGSLDLLQLDLTKRHRPSPDPRRPQAMQHRTDTFSAVTLPCSDFSHFRNCDGPRFSSVHPAQPGVLLHVNPPTSPTSVRSDIVNVPVFLTGQQQAQHHPRRPTSRNATARRDFV